MCSTDTQNTTTLAVFNSSIFHSYVKLDQTFQKSLEERLWGLVELHILSVTHLLNICNNRPCLGQLMKEAGGVSNTAEKNS